MGSVSRNENEISLGRANTHGVVLTLGPRTKTSSGADSNDVSAEERTQWIAYFMRSLGNRINSAEALITHTVPLPEHTKEVPFKGVYPVAETLQVDEVSARTEFVTIL
jgi:hypothetical protein